MEGKIKKYFLRQALSKMHASIKDKDLQIQTMLDEESERVRTLKALYIHFDVSKDRSFQKQQRKPGVKDRVSSFNS